MRNELNQIELIEAYLLGTLSSTEQASFENRLQSDPELARDVELQKQLTKRFNRGMMVAALNEAHGQWLGANGGGAAGGTGGGSFLGGIGTWITIGALAVVSLSTWWFLRSADDNVEHPDSKQSVMLVDRLDDTAKHFNNVSDTDTFKQDAVSETETALVLDEDSCTDDYTKSELEFGRASKGEKLSGQSSSNAIPIADEIKVQNFEITLPDSETAVKIETPTLTELDLARLSGLDSSADTSRRTSSAPYSPDFDTFFIDPSQKQTLNFQGGRAIITIPANILIDGKGYPVRDEVTILFRDFKTPGDMITEEIPMHWPKAKDTMAFHSAGMYEIRAFTADAKEVYMNSYLKGQPSIRVEYEIDQSVDSLGFYYLNERTNRWEYRGEVAEQVAEKAGDIDQEAISDSVKRNARVVTFNGKPIKKIEGTTKRKGFWARLLEFIGKGTINGKPNQRFKDVFTTPKWLVETQDKNEPVKSPLAIQEHVIREFGYHNYDQLRKMKSKITLFVNPVDSNGNEIEGKNRYVVVEHRTNAAFHFYEDKILMHPHKKYDIVLLCDSGSMYYCSFNDLVQTTNKKSGRYNLEFTDVTQMIGKPSDFDALFHLSRKKSKPASRLN